jgi:hypothetical protein
MVILNDGHSNVLLMGTRSLAVTARIKPFVEAANPLSQEGAGVAQLAVRAVGVVWVGAVGSAVDDIRLTSQGSKPGETFQASKRTMSAQSP